MNNTTNTSKQLYRRALALVALMIILTAASSQLQADTGSCSGQSLTLPFTDVPSSNIFFCSIAQAYFSGLTAGTSATTYSPGANVTREQMAAFITRTQDSALKRSSRRAAAGQWWTPRDVGVLNTTVVGTGPQYSCFDGEDIWVANFGGDSVTQVHASNGRVLGTWTGVNNAHNTIAAAGFIYVIGRENPGKIYRIDPTQAPGVATLVENNVGAHPASITYDGLNLWTGNAGTGAQGTGSITRYNIVTDTATTFTVGFNQPVGIVFDGTHLWVVDAGDDALHRVNLANGAVIETLPMGTIAASAIPVFDGANIWVPVNNGLQVVSTSSPTRLLATLTGNGLGGNNRAVAFDGERIMVTNQSGTVSLWKASSLTPLGNLDLGGLSTPFGVCSDGLHFWISVLDNNVILRF
jgi:hypothetical protein